MLKRFSAQKQELQYAASASSGSHVPSNAPSAMDEGVGRRRGNPSGGLIL